VELVVVRAAEVRAVAAGREAGAGQVAAELGVARVVDLATGAVLAAVEDSEGDRAADQGADLAAGVVEEPAAPEVLAAEQVEEQRAEASRESG
jgi:hypothetical protein